MKPYEAEETLRSVEEARRQTRRVLTEAWFPLILFGVLSLLSAPLVVLFGPEILATYWPVVGILGGLATGLHYRNHGRIIGIQDNAAGYVLTAVGIIVGAVAVGWTAGASGHELLAAIGPMLVVAVGYGVFAWLDRSITLGATAAVLVVLVVALALADVDPQTASVVLAVVFGLATLGIGVVEWRSSTSTGALQ